VVFVHAYGVEFIRVMGGESIRSPIVPQVNKHCVAFPSVEKVAMCWVFLFTAVWM